MMFKRFLGLCCTLVWVTSPRPAWADQALCFYSESSAFSKGSVSTEIAKLGDANLALSQDGQAIGWYKQGQLYARGEVVSRNYEVAETCLQIALEKGYERANYLLGIVLLRLDRGPEALEMLQRALNNDVEAAEKQIAFAHLRSQFGDASDPRLGFAMTQKLAAAGDTQAAYLAAQAINIGAGVPKSAITSFEGMMSLAKDGYPPAMDFVAKALARGDGVKKDVAAAKEWYGKAIAVDFHKSELGLARIYYQQRKYDLSLAAFDRAVEKKVPGAELARARAHSDGRFGRRSEYSNGWTTLTEFSDNGSIDASRAILGKLGRGSGRPANVSLIENQLQTAAEFGNGTAAGALARFYRERPDLSENARQKRMKLLKAKKDIIPASVYSVEAVNDLAQKNRKNLWPVLYRFLLGVSNEAYKPTLVEIRKINRNAFVYAIQKEMNTLGFYSGKATGTLTKKTLNSIFSLCEKVDARRECLISPLGYGTVGRLADALVMLKAAPN